MNKIYCIFFLFFSMTYFAIAAVPWADPDASFRIKVRQPATTNKQPASLLLKQYLLPMPFNGMAKAFLPDGTELIPELDLSRRAILLPHSEKEREIYIYSGYTRNTGDSILRTSPDADMFTMREITYWGGIRGNFQLYLEHQKNNLSRRDKTQYDNLNNNMKRYLYSRYLLPPASGKILPTHPGAVASQKTENTKLPFRVQLYQSRIMQNGREWRLFQSSWAKSFLPDLHYYEARIRSEANSWIRSRERNIQEWNNQLKKNREETIFGQIVNNFAARLNARSPRPLYPSEVNVISRELDLSGSAVLRYTGNLNIETPGEYEFRVVTNTLWIMKINQKTVKFHMFNPIQVPDMRKKYSIQFKIQLEKGVFPFSFHYARHNSQMPLEIHLKKPGESWSPLNENMFIPAAPCKIESITMQDGRTFPLIRRDYVGNYMTGKQTYGQWEYLQLPGNVSLCDKNKMPLTHKNVLAVLTADSKSETWIRSGKDLFPFPSVDQPGNPIILKGVASMNMQVPPVCYNDKVIQAEIILRNDYPMELPLYLRVTEYLNGKEKADPPRPVTLKPAQLTRLQIPLRKISDKIALLSVELLAPGAIIAKKQIHLIPVQKLHDAMDIHYDRFYKDGIPCSLVLQKMQLRDIRRWQLPQILSAWKNDSLLIIGNQKIETILSEKYPHRKSVKRIVFPPQKPNAESCLLQGIPAMVKELQKDVYDTILLIPPTNEIALLGKELFFRYFAVLAETAQNHTERHRIFVVIPALTTPEQERELMLFSREYGFSFLKEKSTKATAE